VRAGAVALALVVLAALLVGSGCFYTLADYANLSEIPT